MTYSPEMVMLVQQLRSRIRAEFGVKIRLVDPELLPTLGEMGKKSRDPYTRKTVAELMSLAGISARPSAAPPSQPLPQQHEADEGAKLTEITYRGRKIYKEANGELRSAPPSAEVSRPNTPKQMYRGQVVNK